MLFCQTVKGSSSWTQNSKIIAASFVKCRIFRLLAIFGTRTRWYWYLCSGSAITESGSRSGILLNPDPDQGSFQDENSEFFSFFFGWGGWMLDCLVSVLDSRSGSADPIESWYETLILIFMKILMEEEIPLCRKGENLGHGEQGAHTQEWVPAHIWAHQGSSLVLG
jgi:hypothetical protein